MKKFCILPALLSVLIFMLCGCETVPNTAQNSQEIMIPLSQPDISFYIPPSFSETSTENNDTAYISGNASIIINKDKLSEKVSGLHSYVTYSKELYQNVTDKYTQINEEDTSINGLDCIVTEFTYEIIGKKDNLSMTCLVGFYNDPINKPNNIYIVTCKADSETYPNYRDDFLNTINSVSLNKGESQNE